MNSNVIQRIRKNVIIVKSRLVLKESNKYGSRVQFRKNFPNKSSSYSSLIDRPIS